MFLTVAAVSADQPPALPKANQYDTCTDFCKAALTVCEGTVDWVTGTVSVPFSRHNQVSGKKKKKSIFGNSELGRPDEQFDACHKICMGWQYFRQEATIDFSQRYYQSYSTGDTLNCRYNHLNFAQGIPRFYYGLQASESESAAQHCQHITPDGGWVCTDYRDEDGLTPPQKLKNSVLKHRLGDCFLTADDKIADCHAKALRDDTVGAALKWLPNDIEYIFLNNNALQNVPDISRFLNLKGIYLDNNSIKTLDTATFSYNKMLEVISMNNNLIGLDTVVEGTVDPNYTLNPSLLYGLTELKAFYINFNYISSIPENFFQSNKEIEMIALVDNAFSEFPEGLLRGLTKLQLFAFGQQGKVSTNYSACRLV